MGREGVNWLSHKRFIGFFITITPLINFFVIAFYLSRIYVEYICIIIFLSLFTMQCVYHDVSIVNTYSLGWMVGSYFFVIVFYMLQIFNEYIYKQTEGCQDSWCHLKWFETFLYFLSFSVISYWVFVSYLVGGMIFNCLRKIMRRNTKAQTVTY